MRLIFLMNPFKNALQKITSAIKILFFFRLKPDFKMQFC